MFRGRGHGSYTWLSDTGFSVAMFSYTWLPNTWLPDAVTTDTRRPRNRRR